MDLSSAKWRKASYSGSNGGNCVEVATNLPGIVAVRDSSWSALRCQPARRRAPEPRPA